ncbi:MAG: 50S ribosomal protein L3 [candidate division KSB1 bacterium]|nr:50S ribosomal protein L3 [candidate division KSB1 bacterium]MDZ7272532.1 50S ribosomal protein L3 [candidate division KSB1 bacterium]MDZ7284444.1 50S ribosomal protein L3 [candidate division KSB1 bacterium]MDZ7297160.1 50S ribosomal protein L3 [candidate division KSB1 bacterium]MDZ7306701.1 50S ribosomal protein L3 [candidate division KSB1 bacterium]
MTGLIGRKLGQSRIFDEKGNSVPVTVVLAGPCYVSEIRTREKHGYESLQLGFAEKPQRKIRKAEAGHFAKAGLPVLQHVREFRDFDNLASFKLGDAIKADIFKVGDLVKATGTSKGKGFQGVVRRHHFGGGPVTHGQSDRTRAPGSMGGSSFPSRVWKGMRMAGRMGGERVTVRNLRVIKVDAENNILMLRGSIPGANNSIVILSK